MRQAGKREKHDIKSALFATVAAFALCGAAGPASATALSYTFNGTVISGYDGRDLFTDGDLTGLSDTVVETFENATLQPTVISGLATYLNSNFVDVAITIGSGTSNGQDFGYGSVALQSGRLVTSLDFPNSTNDKLDFTVLSPGIDTSTTSFSAGPSNAKIAGSFVLGPFDFLDTKAYHPSKNLPC